MDKTRRLYHIYNRGNNKEPIFYSDENFIFFLKKMRRHLTKHSHNLAYCLMPNHFHWLILVDEDSKNNLKEHPLNQQISTLLSSYTQAINKRYKRTGSLFQQGTKMVAIDTLSQARICFHYIHQNPVRAGLVDKMGKWPYSSIPDFCGRRNGTLVKKDTVCKFLNIQERSIIEQFKQALDPGKIQKSQ